MRRSALNSILVLSLTALAAVVCACATSPVDEDLSGLTQNQTQTTDESTKLPAETTPAKVPLAADVEATAPKPVADASAPKPDATTPPPPTGGTGGNCPDKSAYHIKFLASGSTSACPCSASECCYNALGCIAK